MSCEARCRTAHWRVCLYPALFLVTTSSGRAVAVCGVHLGVYLRRDGDDVVLDTVEPAGGAA